MILRSELKEKNKKLEAAFQELKTLDEAKKSFYDSHRP